MAVFSVNNSNGRFTLRLTLTEGAYDVANNTSPVTYKLDLIANTAWNFEMYGIARRVILDGVTVYSGAWKSGEFSIADYGTLTLASGTTTITHDPDGKKTISVAYAMEMDELSYTAGNLSGTGKMELVQIPRAATITSAPDFTDEQNPTISYSNPAGSVVTALDACISLTGSTDDIAYRAVSKTGTSYTFTLTESERNVLRLACADAKSRTVTFYLRTTIGTNIYYTTLTKTLSIVNANPTFGESNLSYQDTNSTVVGITGNNQHIVQNKSALSVSFSAATAKKGASIIGYALSVNGVTKTASASGSVAFGAVNSSRDVTLSVTATDSRGNATTATKTISVIAYSSPVFSVTLERLNNYEDETYLTVDASISSVNGKNTIAVSYKKAQSGGSFGSSTALSNRVKHTTTCDKNYAYTFRVEVADKFETVTKELLLPKGKFPLFIDTEKNAVGINEFPSIGEALRVAGGDAFFEGAIGSGNAAKTRENLGAAPSGYGLGATYGQSVENCNDAVENGWYRVEGTISNTPIGSYGWMLVSVRYSYVWQDFYTTTLPARHFCRNHIDGIWSAWAEATPSAFAPNGYGLGGDSTYVTDWNNAKENGWYWSGGLGANEPFPSFAAWGYTVAATTADGINQVAYTYTSDDWSIDGVFEKKRYYKITTGWSEWEWVNPPMTLGREYRTTEHWRGAAVYARAVNVGYVSAGSQSFAHNCAMKQPISADVFNNSCELLTGYSGITNLTVSTTHVHFSGSNAFGDITFLLKYTK